MQFGNRMARQVAGAGVALGILAACMLFAGSGREADAAGALSPLDRLVIENDIRQQIALYALYADGDGLNPKNTRALADHTLTPTVVNESYTPSGALKSHSEGRDEIVNHTAPADPTSTIASRHFLVSTYFDDVTPTTAKTRTTALQLTITKNMLGADCKKAGENACGGRLVRGITFVYHDDWTKTPDGWQKTHSVIRGDED